MNYPANTGRVPEPAYVHQEFPKWVNGRIVYSAEEEQAVSNKEPEDPPTVTVSVAQMEPAHVEVPPPQMLSGDSNHLFPTPTKSGRRAGVKR